MKQEIPQPTKWTLLGSINPESIARRQELLRSMYETARSKGAEVAQLRQTNLNYALLIFAGLFTFSFQFAKGWYSVIGSAALCLIMCIFCVLDRRLHKFIHGWRATEKHLTEKITYLLNYPSENIEFRRYISEAERNAEWRSLQPMIMYAFILASLFHFVYCLLFSRIK
jgi:hypothetical protein